MSTIDQLAERLKKGISNDIEGIPALLGRKESGGSYTVPTGVDNEVYARLYGDDNNLVTAINLKTQWKARLPVLLRLNSSGRYVVLGVNEKEVPAFLGVDAASANMPPVRGGATEVLWESYQFSPGRIRALNGSDLQVYMEPLAYKNTGLGAVSGDMAAVVGTITSGKKAWIVVSVDPNTNTLAFTKGSEYSLPIVLTRTLANNVVVPTGNMKLWAFNFRSGDTYIPVQRRSPDTLYFVDLRNWLYPDPTETATVATTDATETTIASIPVAEASLLTITGTFSGVLDDYSAAISGTFVAGVRRASGGNATLVGVSVTSNEDSGGTPAFTVDADTGTQTARLRVQGISSENWNWSVKYQVLTT